MEEKCKNCSHWQRDGADGICRKNSPKPIVMEAEKQYVIVWPRLGGEESCGDFKPFTVD